MWARASSGRNRLEPEKLRRTSAKAADEVETVYYEHRTKYHLRRSRRWLAGGLTDLHEPDQRRHVQHLADQAAAAVRKGGHGVQPPNHVQGALQPRLHIVGSDLVSTR